MKSTPYLSIVFGKFFREITRLEAAEILRKVRQTKGTCYRIVPGWMMLGGIDLHTRSI